MSSVYRIRAILDIEEDVFRDFENVLDHPQIQVWFEEFADSSLNFKIKFWINRPQDKYIIRSEVMHKINDSLRENGIKIPFPQRDVHLIGSNKKLK